MSPAPSPETNVKTALTTCLQSGEPLQVSLGDLASLALSIGGVYFTATIEFDSTENPLNGLGLYRLAALLPGVPLAQWLPRQGLLSPITAPKGPVGVERVVFLVETDGNGTPIALAGLGVHLTFTLPPLAPLSSLPISADLTGLVIEVIAPWSSPSVTAILEGTLKFGALDLTATLSCPDFTFSAGLMMGQAYPTFSDILTGFGLPAPDVFKSLVLSEFDLSLSYQGQTAQFLAAAKTDHDQALEIIPNVLAFDSLSVNLQYSGSISGSFASQFTFFNKIVLDTQISSGDGKWTVQANLDLSATLALVYPNPPQPVTALAISDLVEAFGLGLPQQLLAPFSAISIAQIEASFTIPIPKSTGTTYAVYADFKAQWSLGGTSVNIDTTLSFGNGQDASDQVLATIDIDGFSLQLEAALPAKPASGQQPPSAQFTVTASQLGGLTGLYNLGTSTLTLGLKNENSGGKLGDLLAEFISIFTGDPFTALPAPWNLLNDISLASFTLTIDLSNNNVSLDYTLPSAFTFLGCSVTKVTLSYTSKPESGKSKYAIAVHGDFPTINSQNPSWDPTQPYPHWDPTQPSQAPSAPGLGGAYVDLALFAIGQHVVLSNNPTTVEEAIKEIQGLNIPIADPNQLLSATKFDSSAGWLVVGRLILLSQIDLRIIFSDPSIYGATIYVAPKPYFSGAPHFAYLDALAGLFVEILYRKVSSSVGVYEGTLTLPNDIRQIDMGAFQLQLPTIELQIYTNGDFLIDVGFPHNGDFSNSAVISAGEYYGSGGVLYGQLGGVAADGLPAIVHYPAPNENLPVGVFNPVNEFGLGLRVGIYKSFSAGPMSAAMGVLVQGIFQGTFGKFTTQPLVRTVQAESEEFYSIYANVAIIGKLEGSIDFVIISASLLVEIILSASVLAISHRQVEVPMSASVEVRASVSIDCGLFTIHIHFSFSTSISYTASFGSNTTALWERIPGSSSTASLMATSTYLPSPAATASAPAMPRAAQMAMAPAPMAMAAAPLLAAAPLAATSASASVSMTYPPLACETTTLQLYVVPQLTRGTVNDQADWLYVLQFALASPEATAHLGAGATLTNTTGPNAHDFAKLAGAWLLQAYQLYTHGIQPPSGAPGSPLSPSELFAKISVTADDLQGLTDYLHDAVKLANGAVLPSQTDLMNFFAGCLGFTLTQPQQGDSLGLAFFPLLPDLALGADHAVPVMAAQAQSVGEVLLDYVLVTGLAMVQGAQKVLDPRSAIHQPLETVYASMESASAGTGTVIGSAIGTATRFMLHGTRINGSPLYALTGQLFELNDLAMTSLAFTVTAVATPQWGAVGASPLAVAAPFAPNQVSAFATSVQETGIQATTMSLAVTADRQFVLGGGQTGAVAVVRSLPTALTGILRNPSGGTPPNFKLMAPDSTQSSDATLGDADFRWASVVTFNVSKTSDGTNAVYALLSVRSDSLDALETIYTDRTAASPFGPAIEGLEIGYVQTSGASRSQNNSKLTLVPVAWAAGQASTVFMFRSNISTDTAPSQPPQTMAARKLMSAAPPQDAPGSIDFITTLMTGGLTNSGGYYLYCKGGLPDDIFDDHGRAELNLIVRFASAGGLGSGVPLRPSVNAARVTNAAYAQANHLYACSDQLTGIHSSVSPAKVGVVVTRPAPAVPQNDKTYQQNLNSMFNLLIPAAKEIGQVGQPPTPVTDAQAKGVGPLYDASQPDLYNYSRLFDIQSLIGQSWPSTPTGDYAVAMLKNSPYAYNDGQLGVTFQWLDPYGNQIASSLGETQLAIGYTDPLASFGDWPGLAVSYAIGLDATKTARQLTLKRAWSSPVSSQAAPEAVAQQTYNLVAKLATIYHQLTSTAVTLNLSLLATPRLSAPTGGQTLAQLLQADIQAIISSLTTNPGTPPQLADIVFELPASDGAYSSAILFPLTLVADFKRSGQVADGFQNDPTIKQASSMIAPYLFDQSASTGATSKYAYSIFANALEPALSSMDMKLLAGDSDLPKGSRLWVLRFGTSGLTVTAGQADTYAPPPFSTVLLSRSNIVNTISAQGFTIPQQTVANVDLDAQMSAFLNAYETILRPAYLATAVANQDSSIAGLLGTKRILAQALGQRLIDVTSGLAAPQAAINTLTQSCLINLGNYYNDDAIAVMSVTTSLADSTSLSQQLNLYGRPIQSQNANIQVSSAKTKLDVSANGALAMTVKTHTKGEEANYDLPPIFKIEAFEMVTGDIPVPTPGGGGMSAYTVGNWLRFVLDADSQLAISGQVPLPLRAYPQTPVITAQGFTQTASGTPAPASLQDKDEDWQLNLDYRLTCAAQDTLNVTVTLNLEEQSGLMVRALKAGARKDDLLDTLSQFSAYYQQLEPLLESGLKGGQYNTQTAQALAAFAAIATAVAASVNVAIKQGASQPRASGSGSGTGDAYLFNLTQGFHPAQPPQLPTSAPWQVTVIPETAYAAGQWQCPVPVMSILNNSGVNYIGVVPSGTSSQITYQLSVGGTDGGSILMADQAMAAGSRSLSVGPLSIIDQHSGRYSLSIARNLGLNARFQYQTATISPPGQVLPFIDRALDLDLTTLAPAWGSTGDATTLTEALTRLYVHLVTGKGQAPAQQIVGTVQTVIGLSYAANQAAPAGQSAFTLPNRVLPMILNLNESIPFYPQPNDSQVTALVKGQVDAINAWKANENPPAMLLNAARLTFEVSVFSPWSTTGMPIIHFTGLYVPAAKVTWS